MIKDADHIINKEIFEFSCAEADHAFTLQREMNDALLSRIHGTIDQVLDESFDRAQVIRINKLEIDLGEIPFAQLTRLIPSKLYTQFKEKLQAVLIDRKKVIEDNNEREIPGDVETIETFLLTGVLPWWASPPKKFSFNESIKKILETDGTRLKTILLENITNELFIKRLIYQSDKEVFEQLLELDPHLKQLFITIEKIIYNSLSQYTPTKKTDVSGEISSMTTTSPGETNGHVDSDRKKSLEDIWHQDETALNKDITQKAIELLGTNLLSETKHELRSQLKEKILIMFGESIELDKLEDSIDQLITSECYADFEIVKKEIAENSSSHKLQDDNLSIMSNGEKIPIENAGLVLTSTFLPALFQELNWIEDGKFINKESQFKGVFLLHYMATGETAAPEYTLHLNKLLVGLDLEEPIPFSVYLTNKEKEEADQLLNDIVSHWKALKSSSIEGFRGSFILRDGLLSYNESHWLLQVEKKGYDILMEHIPWSWKTVQFAWMETYIDTEW